MNPLADLIANADSRAAQAETILEALLKTPALRRKARNLVYRCPNRKRCALAEIYASPAGVLVYHPTYKLAPEVNAASSSAEGRAANTRDGNNHWNRRVYFLDPADNLTLNCDHVQHHNIDRSEVLHDLKADRAEVVVTKSTDTEPTADRPS